MALVLSKIERRRIVVQGIVQGVGFRPFIYGQALRRELGGFVLNDSAGVTIEVEGQHEALEAFERALFEQAPPLARIDSVVAQALSPRGETAFVIAHSQASAERQALIAPDSATCDDCLRELFDPADRRYGYPFINCTSCGPRFTIVKDVPYDRDKTTMRIFSMCPACQAEYENPLDRRFHAQPNACPVCGPSVSFERWSKNGDDGRRTIDDMPQSPIVDRLSSAAGPIEAAARRLAAGDILAIKGLGGYHLACDALNSAAAIRLRQRKHREAKPFALMAPDLATIRQICELSADEAALLQSRHRPIVLLRRRAGCLVAPDVALIYTTLGVMLPYTPLHHVLLRAFAAAIGADRPALLVMTSGNLSDEPIAYRDGDARTRLAPIAEGLLTHNREIHMRCDDSVVHVVRGIGVQHAVPLRRSRGYAPEPIALSFDSPISLLACGGHLKNTFCLVKGRQAFVSHHIGDLENLETLTAFREGIAHFQRLFDIAPQAIAYDLHPEYLATKEAFAMAENRGQGTGIRDQGSGDCTNQSQPPPNPRSPISGPQLIGVQHHHAHIASVLAEHGLAGPVIGVAADGTGYGTDGAIWGCEIMIADLLGFERLAHLAYMPLPGGEQAVREPWRMAAVYLAQAYGDAFLDLDIPFVRGVRLIAPPLRTRWRPLAQMIARRINSPPASSLGRLFDAVAALLELRDEVIYEGQAAIELEMLAEPGDQVYPFAIGEGRPAQLDVAPMIRAIVEDIRHGVCLPQIAGRFHRSVAELLAATCLQAREQSGLGIVALSGGVFQNRLLLEQLMTRLEELSFQVYLNRHVPPNDGGLSLGQAAIAAAQLGVRAGF
ncbi:MAG TPA: carbamoyltransferase HypF [Roseiflexaceae bacterium]|nr:carbamoyltransferase HypF [Roseiflexaceae bacterium]